MAGCLAASHMTGVATSMPAAVITSPARQPRSPNPYSAGRDRNTSTTTNRGTSRYTPVRTEVLAEQVRQVRAHTVIENAVRGRYPTQGKSCPHPIRPAFSNESRRYDDSLDSPELLAIRRCASTMSTAVRSTTSIAVTFVIGRLRGLSI
jgi:hypothetical protein